MKILSAVTLASLMALGGMLVVTNPSEAKYAEYFSQTATLQTQDSLCQPEKFSEWLGKVGKVIGEACEGLIAGGSRLSDEEIKEIILDNTEYKNRIVFSTYITETPVGEYRTIGALGQFYTNQPSEK